MHCVMGCPPPPPNAHIHTQPGWMRCKSSRSFVLDLRRHHRSTTVSSCPQSWALQVSIYWVAVAHGACMRCCCAHPCSQQDMCGCMRPASSTACAEFACVACLPCALRPCYTCHTPPLAGACRIPISSVLLFLSQQADPVCCLAPSSNLIAGARRIRIPAVLSAADTEEMEHMYTEALVGVQRFHGLPPLSASCVHSPKVSECEHATH